MKMAPTSANCSPARIVFCAVESGAKERLKPALGAGNLEKTMAAPATAIVAMTSNLPKHMPRLFPQLWTPGTVQRPKGR